MRRILIPVAIAAMALVNANAGAQTASRAAATSMGQFAGSEACATCHDGEGKKFDANPHAKLAQMHGGKSITCESCHGPGKAHSEDGDAAKIINPAKLATKKADAMCLNCHAGQHANFEGSLHAKANVGCLSCHSIHASVEERGAIQPQLLKVHQPKLCYSCHADVRPSFDMPFHHKVNEGLVKCSDCHDTHGTFNKSNLRSTADQNAICTSCHTETRGPFVFEHAAVKTEGCVGCHTPHGSQNARLLNMPNINTLCNQCHSPVSSATVHGMGPGSSELTPCISCHTMIHGSNLNQAFIR